MDHYLLRCSDRWLDLVGDAMIDPRSLYLGFVIGSLFVGMLVIGIQCACWCWESKQLTKKIGDEK